VAFLAVWKLISLFDKRQPCRYFVQSRFLEYLDVQQEKQLRNELSINIIMPGENCQVMDIANFL